MKRILITGASGFLGRHLTNRLRRDPQNFVVWLNRDLVGEIPFDTTFPSAVVHGSFEQIERAVSEYEIDTVVHLAAQTQVSVAAKDPVGSLEANVRGTWTVLEACRRQKVRRVIVASSDKAYGRGEVPYKEGQGLRAHGIYAASKACADMVAEAYWQEYRLPVAITRCGNLYGPGHVNWSTLIPGTIRSALKGERPVLRSNGSPKRDFLFVEDAVDAYLHLISCTREENGPFNIGTGVGSTVREVVDEVLRACGREDLKPRNQEMDILFELFRASQPKPGEGGVEIADQILDSSRAKLTMEWQPKHTLAEGLAKTVPWYRGYLGKEIK